jgi:hypothetical protein
MSRASATRLAEELRARLEPLRAALAGAGAPERSRALWRVAGAVDALAGGGLVEVVGGPVEGREHTWVEAAGCWADPAGAAVFGGACAGVLPHPKAGRPQWREPWRGVRDARRG